MYKKQLVAEVLQVNTLNSAPYLGLGRFADHPAEQEPQALQTFRMPPQWTDTEYRRASMEAEVENGIAWQVRTNREERGLKQRDLAARMGTKQSAISKLEDPDGGDVRLSTLVNAAHAFDCALLVRFVSYGEFAAATADVRPDRLLACPFSSEQSAATARQTARQWPLSAGLNSLEDPQSAFGSQASVRVSGAGS